MNDVRDANELLTNEFIEATRRAIEGLPPGEFHLVSSVGYEEPLRQFHPFTSRDINDALYDLADLGIVERHEFDNTFKAVRPR